MLDPEHLLDDIERMIDEECNTVRRNPEREAATWLDQLSAAERKCSSFQDIVAEGLINLDELRGKLADLDDLKQTAERELRLIEGRKGALRQLELDRDALTPEERHQLYQILRIRVTADADRNLTVEGVFGEFSVAEESSTCVIGELFSRWPVRRSAA
jgi:hypothetical protein